MKFIIYLQKYIQQLFQRTLGDFQDIQAILSDPEFKKRKIRDNLHACSFVACLLCIISMTGFIGTYAPRAAGAVLPAINSTTVYLIIFGINLIFLACFYQCLQKVVRDESLSDDLVYVFLFINSSLACLTFFTTQNGSSFFFEYLLMLILVYLLPVYDNIQVLIPIIAINLATTFAVIDVTGHEVAWQDQYDIVLFYLVCLVIIFFRRYLVLSFAQARMHLRSRNEEFYQRSRTDELTGLLNREALREDFEQYFGKALCVMICDIDQFKFYNDTYGHIRGDEILSVVSRLFQKHFGYTGVYRYGGDEFLIISFMPHDGFQHHVETFQNQLCKQPFEAVQRHPTVSGGYTWGYCEGAVSLRTMFAQADQLLYKAKAAGRNRIFGEAFDVEKAEAGLHEMATWINKSS